MRPLLAFVFAFVLVVSRPVTALGRPMGCMELSENFNQCFSFIEGLSRNRTNQCCRKIANLNSFAKKYNGGARTICKCIQKYASFYAQRPFDAARIQELPIKCKTKLSFPISQHMDCSRIK